MSYRFFKYNFRYSSRRPQSQISSGKKLLIMIFNDNLKNFDSNDSNVGRSPWQDTIYRLKTK